MELQSTLAQQLARVKNIMTTATIIAVLAFGINVVTLPVLAQTDDATINQQTNSVTDDTGFTQTQTRNTSGFNWLWLLPLLAIPLLYLVLRRSEEQDEHESQRQYRDYPLDRSMAGSLGGEVNRERDASSDNAEEVTNSATDSDGSRDEAQEHYEVDPWDHSQDR